MSPKILPRLALVVVLSLGVSACHRSKNKEATTPAGTASGSAAAEAPTLLPVSSIEAPATVSAGTFFTAQIHGQLPDPAWRWLSNDVATAPARVILTVKGYRAPGQMAAQVLTPYVAPQRIRKLKPGTLTIEAIGRDGSVSTTVEVLPAKR